MIANRSRSERVLGVLGVFLLAGAVGCGGSPPADDTGEGDEVVNGESGESGKNGKNGENGENGESGESGESGENGENGENGQPAPVTITGKGGDVVELASFPEETLKLLTGDEVLVRLTRTGNSLRGRVSSVRERQLTVVVEASGILQRLKPEEVESVRLLYREDPNETSVDGDVPLNDDEHWLVRFADRDIIGKSARELWTGRFQKNIPLVVAAEFKLDGLVFVKRRGSRVYFVPDEKVLVVKPADKIKLVGTANGFERRDAETIKELGDVYLYLILRKGKVRSFYTKQRLNPGDLDPQSLEDYMDKEQVTLTVNRAGSTKFMKIARVKSRNARAYQKHLKRTPDRATINQLRARQDKGLAKAEKRVRSMYEAVQLKKESDLDEPIVIEFRLPQLVEGRLELVSYSREIGLD